MAGMTTYLTNKVVDHILGKAAYTMPNPVYAALFTTAPTDAGGGVEVTGGAYARISITAGMGASSGGQSTNSGVLAFPTPTAAWGTIQAAGVFDALTAGNLLLWNNLVTPRGVGSGDIVQFNATKLTVVGD